MENVHFFVVFHEKIFDDCYEDISQEVLDKHFTFISVNESIKKVYTPNKYNVVNEWELPVYVDEFQKKAYKENSAIYHVMANNMHANYKYIGFFQYDMKFTKSTLDTITKHTNSDEPTCLYLGAENFKTCASCVEPQVMIHITSKYDSFSFSEDKIYPLWNTYVIPIHTFENVMKWVVTLYSDLSKVLTLKHFGHVAGIYERVMAFAIGEERLKMVKFDINHDHDYKDNLAHSKSIPNIKFDNNPDIFLDSK